MEVFFTWRGRGVILLDQEPPGPALSLDLSVSENGAVIRLVYIFMKAEIQGEMTGTAQQVRLDGCLFFRILLLFPGLYAMENSTRAGSSWARSPYGRSGYHLMNGKEQDVRPKAPDKSSPFSLRTAPPDPRIQLPVNQTSKQIMGKCCRHMEHPFLRSILKGAAAKGKPRNHSFATAPVYFLI